MSSTGPKGPLGLDLSLLSGTSSHYSIREAQALAVKGTGLSVGSLTEGFSSSKPVLILAQRRVAVDYLLPVPTCLAS